MKLRALLLGLLLAFSMNASARIMSADEIDEVCGHWAGVYARIAEFRDNKMEKAAMEAAVQRALANGKINSDYAQRLLHAIRTVYANPDLSPADIGSLIKEKCSADLSSIKS